jgi:ATP-dependent Clp protease ATP-binding subunit ClpA
LKRITLYEYDRKNVVQIFDKIGSDTYILSSESIRQLMISKNDDLNEPNSSIDLESFTYFDLSLLILFDNERIDLWAPLLIIVFQWFEREYPNAVFILDKRYTKDVEDALFHFIDSKKTLERKIHISDVECLNIADIKDDKLNELELYIRENLFGNHKFQIRIFEEIKKFRLFNKINEQPVFSAFICGDSGIGKTETARLLHKFLCPNENFIKINLGNYSDQNALSSLIGSPRGYIGSNKGELSNKIHNSKSTIILIDEFEKAGAEIHNFFLELLSDGKFTDSLGREYDLNKYIIIFTSNIKDEDVNKCIPAELRSRFDFMYKMITLTNDEKLSYINYRCNYYLIKIEQQFSRKLSSEAIARIKQIDIAKIHNLRNLNKQIQIGITNEIQNIGADTDGEIELS